jgi:putative DNA methylase
MSAQSQRLLIEDWLPVEELGIESRRESAPIPGQFPKLKTLHVWWARRPLAASIGAVLGSLLPAWSQELADQYPTASELKSPDAYKAWFLRLCGILGDPIAAKKRLAAANSRGERLANGGYGYRPAFKNRQGTPDLVLLQGVLLSTWGDRPVVLDPTAGGGSIPYQAIRLGASVIANDLNPVAVAILKASLEVTSRQGVDLARDLRDLGGLLVSRLVQRLELFFPHDKGQDRIVAYLFARTVRCPRTGKGIPLSPNWWLARGDRPTAVRVVTERSGQQLERAEYEIVSGTDIDFDPDRGSVAEGDAISPWDGQAVDGDYIREEARAGRLGSELYALALRTPGGRSFRAPTARDLEGLAAAEDELARQLPTWLEDGVIPSELVPPGVKTAEPLNYGMFHWRDMFSPRQLVVHGYFVEEFRRLAHEAPERLGTQRATDVLTILAMMQGKALNFDAILTSWNVNRATLRSVFDAHNLAFKWTYAEFDGAGELLPWCLDQVVDAYSEIAELTRPADSGPLAEPLPWPVPGPSSVTGANAGDLAVVEDGSVSLVCIDPPYYDNVMYAELSDFFYVWEKRTLGLLDAALFSPELTDKKGEAVANVARFQDAGRRRKELAGADYEAKMAAIFSECRRVLRDDGVLTVMFTHKRAEAWDTLGMGLLQAGFRIETSWPVNTESEQSIHQANKNAAASTVFLVCRKREASVGSPPFFEDLEGDVRAAVRDAVDRFSSAGLSGVDLLLSTYGPALSVISARWPVYSSDADPLTGRSRLLRPEEALDAARSEVVRMQRRRLVGTDIQFDAYTDFELIAWETFKAAEFPFDEARRLALATGGLDVDDLARARLVEKKAGTVVLLPPERRLRGGTDDDLPGVRPEEVSFPIAIDAVHTVMYVAATDGLPAARALIDRAGLATDQRFLGCLQGLVNAIPRTRTQTGWARKEAEVLDRLCTAYFPGIVMPRAQEAVENLGLWT